MDSSFHFSSCQNRLFNVRLNGLLFIVTFMDCVLTLRFILFHIQAPSSA